MSDSKGRACTHSFFSNLLAVVFILLNLNAIMSVIFNVPAAIFSTVRRLLIYLPQAVS